MLAGHRGLGNGLRNMGGRRGSGGGDLPEDTETAKLFGAASDRSAFKAAIHSTTHRIGRIIGFQAYNVIPETKVRFSSVQGSIMVSARFDFDQCKVRL